jgi:hypothetical protein
MANTQFIMTLCIDAQFSHSMLPAHFTFTSDYSIPQNSNSLILALHDIARPLEDRWISGKGNTLRRTGEYNRSMKKGHTFRNK